MTMQADLHSHTIVSDGTGTPTDNVRLAKEVGLAALAITDHDTVGGVAEALAAGKELGIEVIPGIEISSAAGKQDIHILGYFISYEDEAFQEKLRGLRDVRHERNKLIIAKLNELGIEITLEEVYSRKTGEDKNIGRPHIAEALLARGYVSSIQEAFDKYLTGGGKAHAVVQRLTPQEAIHLIKKAGGVAVLAHPGLYNNDELVEELVVYGLDGIEVYHPDNDERAVARYEQLARDNGLIMTAGSDFHGYRDGEPYHAEIGARRVPVSTVEQLRKLADMRKNTISR